MQELHKFFTSYRPLNDVMHNDAIQGNNRQYWESLLLYKTFSLYTLCPLARPTCSPVQCSLIFVCLLTKHQHLRIRHKVCYAIHIYCTSMVVMFQSFPGNILMCEMKMMQSARECSYWHLYCTARKQLLLYFVQIDSILLIEEHPDESEVCVCEHTMTNSPSSIWVIS
jgi:hypothetical protein